MTVVYHGNWLIFEMQTEENSKDVIPMTDLDRALIRFSCFITSNAYDL